MLRILFAIIAALAFCQPASGAECGNCHGQRMVGSGAVRTPCPVCDGTGATKSAPGDPRPAVCRITAADGPSRIAGSGVLVQRGQVPIVLTNWHVVRSHRNAITVSWPDGTSSPATVLGSDETWDLAALSVAKPAAEPISIAASAPKLGDAITIAGYGPDGKYLEQSGPVKDFLAPTGRHPRQFFEVQATARQGDSGGPMLDASGRLAGVLFGCRDGLTCGSTSTRLALFLASLPADPSCRDGRCYKP